jgi:hypothetical protein
MPNTGASPVITGNKQGQSILVMNGIDFVTLDGSNNGTDSKNITIENTSYTGNASVIGITNNNGADPSKFVTIKNCHLIGAKSYDPYIDTYVILFNQAGGLNGGGYDNIMITGNHIKKAKMGISILASETNINRFITIHNNILGSADSNFYLQRWGIAVENSANTLISNNDIMGSALGAPFDQIFGIIYYGKCANTKIHNNKIHDWFALGLGSSGIKCSNENDATPTEIFNNLIYNIKTPGLNPGVSNNAAYGIFVRWGGNIKIWHNTIYLSGDFLTGFDSYAPSSACLGFYDQSTNNFDIRNNIFRNSMTNSANPTDTILVRGRAYGIMFTGPVSKFSALDHNDYFINGFRGAIAQHWAGGMGFIAEIDSLEEWQAYTGQEAHSIYSNPGFISDIDPKNLHPTSMQLNSSGSAKILDNDIDGAIRYSPSDMGAYEWSNLITDYHTLAATDVTETSAILNGDINTKGEVVEVYFEYGTTTAYGSGIIPVPPAVRSMGVLQPVIAAVAGLQSNTTYHFRFWGVPKTSAQANVYGEDMLFTTAGSSVPVNLTVSDTISSDTCFNATNTITVAGNGATLVVNAGASATFIAGQKILFLPGTKVLAGGYMHGYITLDNQYCNQPFNALVGNTTGDDNLKSSVADPVSSPSIRVYPNPAAGPVTIEITGKTENGMSIVDFYSLSGVKVMSKELEFPGKHSVSVSELPDGIYFLRLVVGNETKTTKLIKM